MKRFASTALLALGLASCSGPAQQRTQTVVTTTTTTTLADAGNGAARSASTSQRIDPPAVGPAPEVHLPPIARSTLPNGLEVNVVEYHTLPVLQLRLVARAAGTSSDPEGSPGLSTFVGDMLKEGTRRRTSAQIAEAIEFVGGSLQISTDHDATSLSVSVMREHAETALALLGELIAEPSFPQVEIDRLRRREQDRLTQQRNEPRWLSTRAFVTTLYGTHPYGHYDTTPEALRAFTRDDLVRFHRARYLAGSLYLVAVGDVRPQDFAPVVARTLGRIPRGTAPAVRYIDPPARDARQVVVVDRPGSAQSDVRMGNVAVRRSDPQYVPLAVANMVLGGDPSSRLFVDLRERRGFGYGAYSFLTPAVDRGQHLARGSVRSEATADFVAAMIEHFERVAREPPSEDELVRARQFLNASFALSIETPADILGLVSSLRLYGLPDNYWDTYRTQIAQVSAEQSQAAAQQVVHPERNVIVVVGDASQVAEPLRRFGNVRVVDDTGRTLRELPRQP